MTELTFVRIGWDARAEQDLARVWMRGELLDAMRAEVDARNMILLAPTADGGREGTLAVRVEACAGERDLVVAAVAGRAGMLRRYLPLLDDLARSVDAQHIRAHCRDTRVRLMQSIGFAPWETVLRRPV
ncbi:hypothetical protein [Arenibaculum sp.]|jgi:hypothetical protein|uniref:hypothetical protein n=1 Tax=Arenibaculum sp. TaxID=2865862 RepID=UPI002E0F35A4|nr:hypothetical protein [Arenibaculum sp.]